MGCALPTGIGAAFASPGKVVRCIVGDGGLHMNIQELLMLSRYGLPVQIILVNNECLGMIKNYQEKAFSRRYTGTETEFSNIDYSRIAKAYGLPYCKAEKTADLVIVKQLIKESTPCFIELYFPKQFFTNPEPSVDMFLQLPELTEDEKVFIEGNV